MSVFDKLDSAPVAGAESLTSAAVDELADRVGGEPTVIVGMGESTRFARETFDVRVRVFRRLVEHHGFRALALQDGSGVAMELDKYVHLGERSAEAALATAWRPWRTAEMVATLQWIRAYNHDHPDDPVRIFGVKPLQAQPADYDAILHHVRRVAPERLTEITSHLEPIRTAHDIDEHVQRAGGLHPGRRFVEHAADALTLIESLPDRGLDDHILARMRLIVSYHQRSVSGRDAYVGEATEWAERISDYHRRSGLRVAYWDGIAHTSAAPAVLGLAPERGAQPTVGSVLRSRHGQQYVSLAIGFHHGELGVATVPEPAPDLIDARLGEVDLPSHWLDLRRDATGNSWKGPAKLRVISGVYRPSRDADEYMAVSSLTDAFDALVHIREVSPLQRLP